MSTVAQSRATTEEVMQWLGQVMDPEVPVISVVDLGIVRDLSWHDSQQQGEPPRLLVTVTPTYSGCPATEVIAQSIGDTLRAHGVQHVDVQTRLAPAWSTDWISDKGRAALRAYGIAPPVEAAPGGDGRQVIDIGALARPRSAVPCPLCASVRTRLVSQFGSTACKALYQCRDCLEPFDYFKPH